MSPSMRARSSLSRTLRTRARGAAIAAALIVAIASVVPASVVPAAQADPRTVSPRTGEANGSFSFRTANGILPTWETESIRITGVSPGRAITDARGTGALITLPIVGRVGSTNFAAGGFRIANIDTGDYVNCATPAIDTRARVVDCAMRDGSNAQLLRMERITARRIVKSAFSTTLIWSGIALRVADQSSADFLNEELQANVFSPYVTFATGELTVITED